MTAPPSYIPDPQLLKAMVDWVFFGAPRPGAITQKVKITAYPALNVRSGRGTSFPAVVRLTGGSEVEVIPPVVGETWGRLANGSGWVLLQWTRSD